MKKKQMRMRFLITALIPILTGVLIIACDSPASPKPAVPTPTPPDTRPVPNDVTYFGNNNTAGEAPLDTNAYKGTTKPVITMRRNNLYRVGYRFAGWTTKADASEPVYKEGEDISEHVKNYPLQLYAKWEEVFPRISAGESFSTLVTQDGKVYTAGYGANGRLGNNSTADSSTFTEITFPQSRKAQRVSSGWNHSFALLGGGKVAGWGLGDYGKLGMGDKKQGNVTAPESPIYSSIADEERGLGNVVYIAAGPYQTAFINEKGEYWAAGTGNNGALGNGTDERETQFKKVATPGIVVSAAAGWNYVLLVKKDGSLWVSGWGSDGRLGNGGLDVPKLQELKAMGSDNKEVFAGKFDYSMVLKKGGRLLSAGYNLSGKLGQGGTGTKYSFLPVVDTDNKPMTGVAFVSLGRNHSMILKNDGTLWAAGENSEYQLGTGARANQDKAYKVMDRVAHVAAGNNFTLAVTDDGVLWAVGSNANGQFGQGNTISATQWTRITGPADKNPPAGAGEKK
ncbi:MAG: hypothetical protein LBQ55_06720 [Treponema sp.]|jgi:alpha-tubulin suppressor-like RCC1 family protein|nr:hypothetical protein [Treponema sp.]